MNTPDNVVFEEKGDIMRVSLATQPTRGALMALQGVACFAFGVWVLLLSDFDFDRALLVGGLSLLVSPLALYVGAAMGTNHRALTATPETVTFTHGSMPMTTAADSAVETAAIQGLDVTMRQVRSGALAREYYALNAQFDDGEAARLFEIPDEPAVRFMQRKLEQYLADSKEST